MRLITRLSQRRDRVGLLAAGAALTGLVAGPGAAGRDLRGAALPDRPPQHLLR